MRVLVRAAQLIMLALAPSWSSPDPQPPASPAITVLLAVLALTAGLICAYRLYARVRNPASLAAALLACAALAAALAGAVAFSGVHGPLGRGVMYVAVPAWAALALTATAIAQRRFGDAARGRRLAAAILVLAIGAALHIDAAPVFSSRETMWWEVFRRDGDDRRPIAALAAPLLHARRFADAARVADRCALVHPTSCACPMLRANMEISTRELDAALFDAGTAVTGCPQVNAVRAVLAEVLASRGDLAGAEREVQRGLDLGGERAPLRYARAVILEREQRYGEARDEAARAIADGAGRDAELLAAALAIALGELDDATSRLLPLVAADPQDADAQYDLALIADRRDDYNRARQGYLAVLHQDPRYASARYNLAALAWRAGVTEEARHHARAFAEIFPNDPRGAQLAALVGLDR